ncbi:MAG: hypothetical protein ABIR18_07130 [Chitinophagaceae bacterium]
MKKLLAINILLFFLVTTGFSQTDSFDVFTYNSPEFFTKSELPSGTQFIMVNNSESFCSITLYKSQAAGKNVMKDVTNQWNEQVVKRLTKANKKPAQVLTEQMWDGWISTLAIGNFYQNKRKCVVMLYSFRKGRTSACAVFAFSDKIFKGPIQNFSQNLHLKN